MQGVQGAQPSGIAGVRGATPPGVAGRFGGMRGPPTLRKIAFAQHGFVFGGQISDAGVC